MSTAPSSPGLKAGASGAEENGDIAYDEKGGHVFPYSRLAGYIAHDKGRHGRAFSYLKQGGLLHVAGAAPIERYAHPGG